jgi:HlyD family secretion protein
MKKIISYIKLHLWISLIIVVIVIGGCFLFFRSNNVSLETMVIQPQDFVNTISVSGTVQAAQNVNLGFSQSGRISHVYAQVGDTVTAGDPLAEIENDDLRATVAQKEAALAIQQADLVALQQGTTPAQLAITESQITNDQTNLQNVTSQQAILVANAQSAELNAGLEIQSAPGSITPGYTLTLSGTYTGIPGIYTIVVHGGSTSYFNYSGIETGTGTTSNNGTPIQLGTKGLFITFPIGFSSESNTNWIVTIPNTQSPLYLSAQSAYTAAVGTQNDAIAAAQATLTVDQKNLALEEAGSTQADINAQIAQVASAQADVENAQALLAESIVTAPFDGEVTQMDAKVGEIVSSNTSEISMIGNGLFQIVSYIPEVYIAGLNIGDTAHVTLDAYGPNVFFDAKVIAIDPAETVVNGVSTYKTTLQFLQPDSRIKSGMTASTTINTQDIPNSIVIPQGALITKNGETVVDVKQENKIISQTVQTGNTSSIGQVVITSGLSTGDLIILNPTQ